MELDAWKIKNNKARNYAHFDNKICLSEVWNYISDPQNIEKHNFYPFIHYDKKFVKYDNTKENKKKEKVRPISYSAHKDRYIFQYYSYKLNQYYNNRVKMDNIDNVAIAYRDNFSGKCNIHFAKEAIDFIRYCKNCYVLIGDFTGFFDNLDHKYLKSRLCDLLGCGKVLPNDYYAVYKNITKYSYWLMESILGINGLENTEKDIKELNKLNHALTIEQFKEHKKLCLKKRKEDKGIPQGSAISAILSNIYMLEFDKKINDFVSFFHGKYMRYNDDFIIILPEINSEIFKMQYEFIKNSIKDTAGLELESEKTQVFKYSDTVLKNCNNLAVENIENGKDIINYLGFSFDGKVVTIRAKTISKYYYRMYRKVKTIVKNNGYTTKKIIKNGKTTKKEVKISKKNLYKKFTCKGAHIKGEQGNFITYVNNALEVFGSNEAIDRSTKNHMYKIGKRLNKIKI